MSPPNISQHPSRAPMSLFPSNIRSISTLFQAPKNHPTPHSPILGQSQHSSRAATSASPNLNTLPGLLRAPPPNLNTLPGLLRAPPPIPHSQHSSRTPTTPSLTLSGLLRVPPPIFKAFQVSYELLPTLPRLLQAPPSILNTFTALLEPLPS